MTKSICFAKVATKHTRRAACIARRFSSVDLDTREEGAQTRRMATRRPKRFESRLATREKHTAHLAGSKPRSRALLGLEDSVEEREQEGRVAENLGRRQKSWPLAKISGGGENQELG